MRKKDGQEQRLGRPNGRRIQVRLDFVAQGAKEGAAQKLDGLLAGIVRYAGAQDIAAVLAKAIEVVGYSDVRLVGAASGAAAGADGRLPRPDEAVALPGAGEESQEDRSTPSSRRSTSSRYGRSPRATRSCPTS